MSLEEHKAHAPKSVGCWVATVSDTRTTLTDTSGKAILSMLTAQGHVVVGYSIIKDEPSQIEQLIQDCVANPMVQAVILNGGTGISKRDQTVEALERLFEKRLEGFGELFRSLSFGEIGSAALLSRATAGLVRGKVVVALPGSEAAVRLGMERLILPELGHMVGEAAK